jgi:hypothetical protein
MDFLGWFLTCSYHHDPTIGEPCREGPEGAAFERQKIAGNGHTRF